MDDKFINRGRQALHSCKLRSFDDPPLR